MFKIGVDFLKKIGNVGATNQGGSMSAPLVCLPLKWRKIKVFSMPELKGIVFNGSFLWCFLRYFLDKNLCYALF